MTSYVKKKPSSYQPSTYEAVKYNANYMDVVLIPEDEDAVLQDIQEYVRESTPEYLRKETLLY
jgi:hypothetical protein